jgi:3-oxoisoapionate kinase
MSDLLLSYYGDDLTGSTDVMEALASNGVPTVLFLRRPGPDALARFVSFRAVGLAGTSRSETPAWMEAHLPDAFAWLKGLGAPIVHYKVCSTFDSSPSVGSVGRAAEIGRRIFGTRVVPVVVGAPQIRRYTAFGTLFAAFRGEVYRIDRHPVMSRHPVTPMEEADLRLHLARQTGMPVALVDLAALMRPDADEVVDAASGQAGSLILMDVVDAATQEAAGRQLRRLEQRGEAFVVGSSGVEYALVAEWRRSGLARSPEPFPTVPPVERTAIVSGSCSPTTERQIRHAAGEGFDTVALDPRRLACRERAAVEAAVAAGLASLSAGRSVILHTALGPSTDLGGEIDGTEGGGRHAIGEALGDMLRALVERARLRRAVIAGGDTSSHALQRLGIEALTTRMPIPASPGSPLCLAHAPDAAFDGLEIALKGGQIGDDDYFVRLRDGRLA